MYFYSFLVFVLGAIVGSFLNVVILRYNTGEKIVKDRSRCFSCGKRLTWKELVPVFSFAVQKGKCRGCKSKISWQYPIVEILTGIMFLLIFNFISSLFGVALMGGYFIQLLNFSNPTSFYFLFSILYYFVVFSFLLIIAVYDFRHQIIPNPWVWWFAGLSFFSVFFEVGFFDLFGIWSMVFGILGRRILTGLVLWLFFAAFWYFSGGRAMGFGDAKLALGMGLLLGPEKGVAAAILAFWLGALVGIFLLIFKGKRYTMKSKIAFGPFLILATFLIFLWGDQITNAALGFLSFPFLESF